MRKVILYLVRKRMGLEKFEPFQFVNQKSDAIYYFSDDGIMKDWYGYTYKSGVSLNWLLDDECEIRKCEGVVRK